MVPSRPAPPPRMLLAISRPDLLLIRTSRTYAKSIHKGDVVAQLVGGVVAQLAKATGRHQTEDAAVPSSSPAPQQSPERGQGI
jgi:hypothetical protein